MTTDCNSGKSLKYDIINYKVYRNVGSKNQSHIASTMPMEHPQAFALRCLHTSYSAAPLS